MFQYRSHHLKLMLVLLVGLLLALPVSGQQREHITIASYNVENFFDVFDDPYTSDERTRVKPREEIEAVARAIRTLDADVVVMQEIENGFVLEAMARTFLADQQYNYIAASKTNSGRGMRVGVISRLPIDSISSYRFRELTLEDDPRSWRFARDLMHIQLKVAGDKPLHVFNVHYKSKWDSAGDPQSRAWRLAEATETRDVINRVLKDDPDALVVLAGDFNDTPDSPTIAAMTEPLEERNLPGLFDVHHHLSPDERITFLNPPYRSTIDYILVSPAMARLYIPDSGIVVMDVELLKGADHAPIAASFRLRPE